MHFSEMKKTRGRKMAIRKPKKENLEDKYISAAPDAQSQDKREARKKLKGNKVQISLTIAPEILRKVDEMAAELGLSRAALINLAIYQGIENGIRVEKYEN